MTFQEIRAINTLMHSQISTRSIIKTDLVGDKVLKRYRMRIINEMKMKAAKPLSKFAFLIGLKRKKIKYIIS